MTPPTARLVVELDREDFDEAVRDDYLAVAALPVIELRPRGELMGAERHAISIVPLGPNFRRDLKHEPGPGLHVCVYMKGEHHAQPKA